MFIDQRQSCARTAFKTAKTYSACGPLTKHREKFQNLEIQET